MLKAPLWRRIARSLARGLAAIAALYLVARGIAEVFVIDYSRPASYRNDWGGPSLAGVLAVHSGPALVILVVTVGYVRRLRTARRDQAAG